VCHSLRYYPTDEYTKPTDAVTIILANINQLQLLFYGFKIGDHIRNNILDVVV